MIVIDASALVELVLATELGDQVARRLDDPSIGIHAPHLIDLEIAQALRRYENRGEITAKAAVEALSLVRDLDLYRHAHEPLLDRIWALRSNVSAYDAAYVALAEALRACLLTCDARLSRAPGLHARVELIGTSDD